MKPFIYHIIVREKGDENKVCDFNCEGYDHRFVCDYALDLAKNEGLRDPYIDMLSVLGVKDFEESRG